jgi:alkylation response protein AidB-like acyl-CoA dehydrogenase
VVLKFGCDEVLEMYFRVREDLLDPNFKGLSFYHAISAFIKSHLSASLTEDLAELRQTLGGIGFSHYVEIGDLIKDSDVHTTWEGDNKVLLQ